MNIYNNGNLIYIGDIVDNLANIEYHIEEDNYIIIDSIYISDHLRGQGIASDLLEYLMQYSRENNLKINPTFIEIK